MKVWSSLPTTCWTKTKRQNWYLNQSKYCCAAFFRSVVRPARALERIQAQVGDVRHVRLGLFAQPAGRLVDEAELVVVNAHRADRAFAEVEDFVTRGRPFAGDGVQLVVAIQMVLVGPVADLLALQQFVGDVRIAGRGHEGRQPVQAGEDAVLHRVRRHMARPAKECRHAEAAFEDRSLGLRERRLTAIGPGKDFGAVVGGEDDDGVVVHAHVLELLHHQTDVVIELGHAGFLFRPAILRVAHRFIFRREMRHDVHARRVEPDEERLVVVLGLVHEIEGKVADFVVHRFHPLGIERAGILDPLLADLAPARHLGRIILVGGPAVNHVARADDVQQVLRIVGMRRVFHRIEVIQIAEEFVEAVDGRQELVLVAEVVLAELAGGVAHRFQYRRDGHRLGRQAGRRAGLADRGHAGADRQFAGDEVRATRRATRLGIVVREQHAFLGDLVEVRRSARHHAAVIGADVPHADVVAHDDDDVGWFRGGLCVGCAALSANPRVKPAAAIMPVFMSRHSLFRFCSVSARCSDLINSRISRGSLEAGDQSRFCDFPVRAMSAGPVISSPKQRRGSKISKRCAQQNWQPRR